MKSERKIQVSLAKLNLTGNLQKAFLVPKLTLKVADWSILSVEVVNLSFGNILAKRLPKFGPLSGFSNNRRVFLLLLLLLLLLQLTFANSYRARSWK